jgi:hypothetical protein
VRGGANADKLVLLDGIPVFGRALRESASAINRTPWPAPSCIPG